MSPLQIQTPYPPGPLWPNKRPHWAKRARLVRAQRLAAHLATRAAIAARPANDQWQPCNSPSLTISLHCPGPRPDPDNAIAALKSTIDGLVDGGALTDDRQLTLILKHILSRTQWTDLYRAKPIKRPKGPIQYNLLPYLSAVFLTINPENQID